jgi:hypothetical protein
MSDDATASTRPTEVFAAIDNLRWQVSILQKLAREFPDVALKVLEEKSLYLRLRYLRMDTLSTVAQYCLRFPDRKLRMEIFESLLQIVESLNGRRFAETQKLLQIDPSKVCFWSHFVEILYYSIEPPIALERIN